MAITGNLVLPDNVIHRGSVIVERGIITGIRTQDDRFPEADAKNIDYGEAYIAPGFVDLHLHGALGKDVMNGEEKSLRTIAEYQAKSGVSGFLASTMSSSMDHILQTIGMIRNAAEGPLPSALLGVHVEGPFVSKLKKGAHSASHIRGMTEDDRERLAKALRGLHGIISLAPEVGENMHRIAPLKKDGFVVAIGHTDATYEQALESFARGITHATHLFNAMSGFHHRAPGVVGAVLDSEDVTAELIADGVHVHPAALRVAVAKKGPEKICLVTDSMLAAGLGDGVYRWDEKEIDVRGNKATIRESGVLAGSILTLHAAVKNMMEWTGVSLNQAINMASLNPARVMGVEKKMGSIRVGSLANFVVLDQDIQVVDAISKGRSILRKGDGDDL